MYPTLACQHQLQHTGDVYFTFMQDRNVSVLFFMPPPPPRYRVQTHSVETDEATGAYNMDVKIEINPEGD